MTFQGLEGPTQKSQRLPRNRRLGGVFRIEQCRVQHRTQRRIQQTKLTKWPRWIHEFSIKYVHTILISWEHSKLMLKPYFRSTSEGQLAGITRLWDRRNFLGRRETDRRAVVQSVSSPWCDQGLPIWPIFFCTLLTKVEGFADVFSMWFRKWRYRRGFCHWNTSLYSQKVPQTYV